VKDDFTSILGQVVFDENDLYSGETQKILALQKLNKKDVAVLQFLKDIDVLMDLKHKVFSLIKNSGEVFTHNTLFSKGIGKIRLQDCLDPP
jgi:hypothetical protein